MTSRRELDADLAEMKAWIRRTATQYPPLDIADVEAAIDVDADGNTRIFITLFLNPPAGGGPWSTQALLRFYEAADDWALDHGYRFGPNVHLRDAALAEAG